MKIYTKAGDKGKTALLGGKRVAKSDPRVEAYGSVDELNATLGAALARIETPEIKTFIPGIQRTLFSIGAQLADARPINKQGPAKMPDVRLSDVKALEEEIDRCQAQLPLLTKFILPSGTVGGTALHLTRTVCRRAERRVVACAKKKAIPRMILMYLNRLSDLLFVWARTENHQAGVEEATWEGLGK